MNTASLIVTSGFSKFRYGVSDISGRDLGELKLRTLPKDPITLDIEGKRYRIDYMVTSDRLLANNVRFALIGDDGQIVSAEKITGRKDFDVVLGGTDYRFTNRSSLFSLGYTLTGPGNRTIATLTETTGFSLWRRRFQIDLQDNIDRPVAIFLFFLAINLRYR